MSREKVLMLASVASMIEQFNRRNIKILLELGYEVDVACNFKSGNTCSGRKIEELKKELNMLHVRCFQIDFSRSVTDLKHQCIAFWQVKELCMDNGYAFMHCQSPIGGAIGRLAAKLTGTKVIYTAHGFHFFKGAPLKNWLLFYPIEKGLSYFTDVMVTINREDYSRAKTQFHAKMTKYLPGIGIDTAKIASCSVNREKKRQQLKIPSDAFVLLSAGELQERKNHRVVLEALYKMKNPDIVYLLAGQGELEKKYRSFIRSHGMEKYIRLLGFRDDITELCKIADCFIHPSKREGFGIAPMEAMAAGLPLIAANVNGMKDYTEDGRTGICVNPESAEEMCRAVLKMYHSRPFCHKCGAYNAQVAKKYDSCVSDRIMKNIYRQMGCSAREESMV